MSEKKTGVESLIVWQASIDLAVKVCQEILNLLPSNEEFALAPQLDVRFKAFLQILLKGMDAIIIRIMFVSAISLEDRWKKR